MKPSAACIDCIKKSEGLRLKAYLCPAGVWTVGYGSTGPGITRSTVWTIAQADARFVEDVIAFAAQVEKWLAGAPTTQGQFDAMVSLAYNIGINAFRNSTLLKLHRANDFAGAARQFARWNKAGGRILPGLVRRRATEALMYDS